MYVVLGATGHTGSAVANTLLERKQPVRVVVRSPEKGAAWKAKGAEVALASYEDPSSLAQALRGAEGAYLLVPPNYGAQAWLASQQKAMTQAAEAVKAAGLQHVVFLSSVGGQLPEGTGPIRAVRYGEQVLGAACPHLTILRPPYFFDNWGPVLETVKAQGVLPTFLPPGAKLPMISTRDIGRIAAERLLAGGHGRTVVEIMGPEPYSPNDVAAELGRLLGRPVTAQQVPLSEAIPTFTSLGFSDEAAQLFEEMYASFGKGAITYEAPGTLVRGRITLAEALRPMVSTG